MTCASLFVVLLSDHSTLSLVPLQALAMGYPEQLVGFVFGTCWIRYSLIQLPAGALSDRYGRKWLVVLKSLSPPVALLLLGYLPHTSAIPIVPLTMGLVLFAGIGLGVGTPALLAVVAESVPSQGDGSTAFSVLFTPLTAPGLLMSSIGGLVDTLGFTGAFTIVAAVGLAGALIAALFLKETLAKRPADGR